MCENDIAAGVAPDLRNARFWTAVSAVKRNPELVDEFAERIGAIDSVAHASWARFIIPLRTGTFLAVLGSLVGAGIVVASISADLTLLFDVSTIPAEFTNGFAFLVGTGVLIGSTHGLGHLVVGWAVGIRFTCWFVGRGRPQPGVKTNYASYLRTPPRSRAWMHASGALTTKAIPFLLLPAAVVSNSIPNWVPVVLFVLGVVQIVTDAIWSTKASDWKKFSREMSYAA